MALYEIHLTEWEAEHGGSDGASLTADQHALVEHRGSAATFRSAAKPY
jgi:hypothetical protein